MMPCGIAWTIQQRHSLYKRQDATHVTHHTTWYTTWHQTKSINGERIFGNTRVFRAQPRSHTASIWVCALRIYLLLRGILKATINIVLALSSCAYSLSTHICNCAERERRCVFARSRARCEEQSRWANYKLASAQSSPPRPPPSWLLDSLCV